MENHYIENRGIKIKNFWKEYKIHIYAYSAITLFMLLVFIPWAIGWLTILL